MNVRRVELLAAGLMVMVFLLLSACRMERTVESGEPLPKDEAPQVGDRDDFPMMANGAPVISRHAWDLLTRMDGEVEGFGMYTYVLFPRRVDQPGLAPEVQERYAKLLEAIAGVTLGLPEFGDLTPRDKQETNLLYVPALASGAELSLANYNAPLALHYLANIARLCRTNNPRLAARLDERPGPFLISLLQPVGQVGGESVTLLYADLSTTNPAALPAVVTAYKTRLTRAPLADMERFTTLRLALLNLILNADNNLRLVSVALADWVPQ
ncbi:hypothetical protein [Geoalkalibacter halelectricus]|uniref:Lipoprotein n=1 Tax=Geoalkalibacter halelectricus TaxID=2847045 RepID=A0ABY5ZKB8_9BACT|nr:hypothetical protein [Geoalkalibacter halelectricus]MDO3378273.1 hypothetical protein [Geoalkalibacter halelectricus]UWZ79136.1 hypothetical protein L9S41_15840 [Geoalkalibacter halelectricus]